MSDTVTREPGPQTSTKPAPAKIAWVNQNLAVGFPGMPPPPPPMPIGKPVTFAGMQKSRLAWDALRKSLQSQLQGLETAIVEAVKQHNEDESTEDEFSSNDVMTGTKKLHEILAHLDGRLIDALDKALNAQGPERAKQQRQAKEIIAEYQAFVQQDPMVASIDNNGFIATTIRPTVMNTLTVLSENL